MFFHDHIIANVAVVVDDRLVRIELAGPFDSDNWVGRKVVVAFGLRAYSIPEDTQIWEGQFSVDWSMRDDLFPPPFSDWAQPKVAELLTLGTSRVLDVAPEDTADYTYVNIEWDDWEAAQKVSPPTVKSLLPFAAKLLAEVSDEGIALSPFGLALSLKTSVAITFRVLTALEKRQCASPPTTPDPYVGIQMPDGAIDRLEALAQRKQSANTSGPIGSSDLNGAEMEYDGFISYASEDRAIAQELFEMLTAAGLKVWFDQAELKVGDKLLRRINEGLAKSKAGIVLLSPDFFAKEWPQKELDGLMVLESGGLCKILPVWHNVDQKVVASKSPTLAGVIAAKTSVGLRRVADSLLDALRDEHDIKTYMFAPYMNGIVKALYNKGNVVTIKLKDLIPLAGAGAYGNHRKLARAPWGLVTYPTNGEITLSEKGIKFASGQLAIPFEVAHRDPASDEYIAVEDTRMVTVEDM